MYGPFTTDSAVSFGLQHYEEEEDEGEEEKDEGEEGGYERMRSKAEHRKWHRRPMSQK